MVFVALSDIAYSFDKSLKDVSLVVIIHGLTICALILPMGRLADIVGRKKNIYIWVGDFYLGVIVFRLLTKF